MTKRVLLLIFAGMFLLMSFKSSSPKEKEKLNVVLFLVDDLGWTDVGCYGSSLYETPNIDRFAEQGVRFTNAYAACHVCSPTRASLMTGKYPATLHLTDWLPGRKDFPFQKLLNADINHHLPFEETTIAEALKEQGYSTAIFGKWHLGDTPSDPLHHGFDIHLPRNWNFCCPPRSGYKAPWDLEGLEDEPGDYLTDRLTDEALKYIGQHREEPFFLYLSHFAVHDPIDGRPDLVEKYRNKLQRMDPAHIVPYILEGNPDSEDPYTREQLDKMVELPEYQGYEAFPESLVKIKQIQDNPEFAGMVESMDESLGRVLSKLKELGLEEKTIVIFFSDNGGMSAANFGNPNRVIEESELDYAYSTSNLPLRGGKGWLYEGGIREPLIVKWPSRGKQGTVCDEPVISTDIFPSVMDMLGMSISADLKLDGVSFAPLVRGEKDFERGPIYWHFPHYSNHGLQSPGGAIRNGDYKLLEYFENNTVQLFNLKKDPGEHYDLSGSEPDKVDELRKLLHRWRNEINAQMMTSNPHYFNIQGELKRMYSGRTAQGRGSLPAMNQ